MSLKMPGRQLSLFGAESAEPSPGDLAGLLAGPGQVVRMGGTARVSVVVDAAWRVHVLVAEMAARGLTASWVGTADEHLGVRTAYARSLAPLATAWLRGAMKRPPADFHVDGPRLRLWVAAAGTPGPAGFLLRLGPSDEACWGVVGAALAAVGLPAVLVGPRAVAGAARGEVGTDGRGTGAARNGTGAALGEAGAAPGEADAVPGEAGAVPGEEGVARGGEGAAGDDTAGTAVPPPLAQVPGSDRIAGPAYRITGRRRLARLAELIGEPPPAVPAHAWPGA